MRTLLILLLLTQAAHGGRRYLLVVGENRGDPDQQALRYAEADAHAMRDVLVSLGGVEQPDSMALFGATATSLRQALTTLTADFARNEAGPQDTLLVYVSSHAADGALRLQGSAFPLGELRQFVEAAPVGVAVLILDTCHAGWINRAKGLKPLTDRTVVVEAPPVAGRVFIASAGPFEPAQESDRLGGSYFTHHLVAALRGAADRSADGEVTLWEAFAYARARTLEGTLGSRGGRQTPSYEVQLAGQRELVLTELHRGHALLTLTQTQPADWVISALDGDQRSTRFSSTGPMVFSLDPGTYRIRTSTGEGAFEHEVTLEEGAALTLDERDLRAWSPADDSRTKGGASFTLALGAQMGTSAVESTLVLLPGFALSLGYEPSGRLAYDLQVGMRVGEAEAQGTVFSQKEVELAAHLTWRQLFGLSGLRLGAELGGVLVLQQDTPRGDITGFQPRLGGRAALRLPFTDGAFLDLSAAGGGQSVRTFQATRIRPYALGSLAIGMWL